MIIFVKIDVIFGIWILVFVHYTTGVSYNLPKFCPNATWNPNGITFADNSTIGPTPFGIFINRNNTVHATIAGTNQVEVWLEGSINPTRTLVGDLHAPNGIFVTSNEDIYVDNGDNRQINKWTMNSNSSIYVTDAPWKCIGLFLDIDLNLYCSIDVQNHVLKRTFINGANISTMVAGNGTAGSAPNLLFDPNGIFVDTNFNLYVADWGNNRIQLFPSGELNATTVAGNGAPETFSLNGPVAVILDADSYLYIVDLAMSRIVGSGPNGFRCLIGCSNLGGVAPDHLSYPRSLAFDSYGNLFVTDSGNQRIQKFTLTSDLCSENSTDFQHTTLATSVSVASTEVATKKTDCYSPVVTFIPSISSMATPIQFRRSQDISINPIIQLSCAVSLSILTKWTLINCTSSCSSSIPDNSLIATTFSDLFIPAQTLPYGIYQLTLKITMVSVPALTTSASVYVEITQSNITANLVQFGTSMITTSAKKDLILDPGGYSVDPDSAIFNASNWIYTYYCQSYDLYNSNNYGPLLPIDYNNNSCFSTALNNRTIWMYNSTISPQSSVRILAGSLTLNQTYRFVVYMANRQNQHIQAAGYLLVKVEDTDPQMIAVACVISTMCSLDLEYQTINPTTQVALFSVCLGNCTSLSNITWIIYRGSVNSPNNTVQWTQFRSINPSSNAKMFGTNTSNFTVTNQLFLENLQISYWRFQVIYSFLTDQSSSALNFIINHPPQNGFCSINPLLGTTSTLFTIICSNWSDPNGIKDYSFYAWTGNSSEKLMIGSSVETPFQLRLPANSDNTSSVHVIVYIRDTLNAVTEFDIPSLVIIPNMTDIMSLINILEQSNKEMINMNSIMQLISTETANTVVQVLTSLSLVLNGMNNQNVANAISHGIPAISMSISPLDSTSAQISLMPFNTSALIAYNQLLNTSANARDYLIVFLANLPISTSASVLSQASTLAQFTDATNQLTRTTSMLASSKCLQLSTALQSMATRLSFEDVQTAAQSIAQCAANVLSAVNQPLQERGTVLNLDFTRANAFPDDYDTDLESAWSNPTLFADGNDFSWLTIQTNRNIYYQNQLASTISTQVNEIFSAITTALKIHLNIGQSMIINTSAVFFSMEVISVQSLPNKLIQLPRNGLIHFPSHFNLTMNTPISLRSIMQPLASADNSRLLTCTNLSTMISFAILDQYNNDISFQASRNDPIEIIIPRDQNLIVPPMTWQNTTLMNNQNRSFALYYINLTRNNNFTSSFHLEMRPSNPQLAYLLTYQFDSIPGLINQIDGWFSFCPSNSINDSLYTYFIDNQQISTHQSIVLTLRELNFTEMNHLCSNISLTDILSIISNQSFYFSADYELRMYTSACYYLDSDNNWQSDGLIVGPLTNHYQTQCYVTEPNTYAAGFSFLPSPIDWNYVFTHTDFGQNRNLYISVITVGIVYLVLIIYARLQDKKDIVKLDVLALPDNHPTDQYFYQIIVVTGHRQNAGTKSKVYFILSGDYGETNVRVLTNPHREILQRSSIDSFILAVPKSLGSLNYFRIWHDNTGSDSSADWFLKYIVVRNLQTSKINHFICQRWFAIDKDDGLIERILPVSDQLDVQEFTSNLSKRAYYDMSEKHLWFSIFSKPPSSLFTRIQRCTCCFVLLLFDMLLNILYYQQLEEPQTNEEVGGLTFGFLYITLEQIVIGIVVVLFSFLFDNLLVQFFRRIRSRQERISPLRQTLETMTGEKINSMKVPSKKRKWTFPWWFIFHGYAFSLLSIAISILLIFARGIEFGQIKTQKWLTSVLIGFLTSIIFLEPLKIIILAMIFTFCLRTVPEKNELAAYFDDDIILVNIEDYSRQTKRKSSFALHSRIRIHRLSEIELAFARRQRSKETKMWSILKKISIDLCFISILFLISYSNRNVNSFNQVKHLRNFFLNIGHSNLDYTKIVSIDDYWNWLEQSFLFNLRAQQWYNGNPPRNLSGFINDKSNRILGWAIMRQLRVKPESCLRSSFARQMNLTCNADESLSNEEQRSFQPGWLNQSLNNSSSSIDKAFTYTNGYNYEFRGRLSDLRGNLSALHRLTWIDKQTRSVIIQLSLYNPNVELFTSVTFLVEFSPVGGALTTARFEPIYFQSENSRFYLILIILYMIFILYFLMIEIRSIYRLKFAYFYRLKSYAELGILLFSWISAGVYIWRYEEIKYIGTLFRTTHGFTYINFQNAVSINNLFTYLLSFCCFFGSLRLLEYCRFHRRLSILHDTLEHAIKDLLAFFLTFIILFLSFLILFYLLFLSKISACSSLLRTSQMLFQILLLNFDANELYQSDAFLGPFCFTLYIIFVVFIGMNIFISIIIRSFRVVRRDIHLISNDDQELFQYMIRKFLHWIGMKKFDQEERDIIMRSKYYDPIAYFPELIDRILEILSRLYFNQPIQINEQKQQPQSYQNVPVILISPE